MVTMNPEIKKSWIEALRSGKYIQGRGTLKIINTVGLAEFCCLGVLCEIQPKEIKEKFNIYYFDNILFCQGKKSFLSSDFEDYVGLNFDTQWTLSTKNDFGDSFAQIADWIEKNV